MSFSIMHIMHSGAVGGGPVTFKILVRGLGNRGYNNIAVCDNDGPLLDNLHALGVQTVSMPLCTKWRFLYNIPRLIRFIKLQKPDAIILHGQFAGAFGGIAARLAGNRSILYIANFPSFSTDYDLLRKIRNHIAEWISCSCAMIVVCVCEANIKEYIRRRLVSSNKVRLIHHSSNHSDHNSNDIKIKETQLPKGRLLGFVGRLADQKGVSILIDAAEPLLRRMRDLHLVIAGDGPLRKDLEKQVADKRLSHRVHFLGMRIDVPLLMKKFDVVAIPSLYEPFGIVAIEAMIAAKPIVASKVDGLSETIIDGVNGFHVAPGNARELREKIDFLLQNPEICKKFGEAGKRIACEKFSPESMINHYEDEIKKILSMTKH
jgi:glycosyltransferase involved in cell wall biosynthesis